MSAPYTELETPLEEHAMLCRSCLAASGEMKNIFEWGLADDFYNFTNVKLQKSDGLSELLCVECEDVLRTCNRFRMQCQNSDRILRATAKGKNQPMSTKQQRSNHENTISCLMLDKKLVLMISAPDMTAKIYLSCPYCPENYVKQKDLMLHLVKLHKVSEKDYSIELKYYCSIPSCSYYINSGKDKHFQGRKYLNQHYAKVHMHKVLICDDCNRNFATESQYRSHLKSCNVTYICQICDVKYNTNEKLLVHLLRKHPELHKHYKNENALKRKSSTVTEAKKQKNDEKSDYICDSPKRSSATQTKPEENIKNDVTLPSWQWKNNFEIKTDEISTQTVFEDLLSLKSQTSEDESIFFSETVSLSDIQTQTFPLEFGLSRSNKETLTSETQSPDLSIKETQTCFCLYDSPKANYRLFDSVNSSPCSLNLTSSETQTQDLKSSVKSDVLLGFNSAETQTSFEEGIQKGAF